MILGYGIIAVPTGIVSAEYTNQNKTKKQEDSKLHLNSQSCANCLAEKHQDDAKFCHKCGHPLH
jgi:voltage-gated potassium channel